MRRIVFLVLVLLLVSPAVLAEDEDKGELAEGQAMAALEVTGMTCGACCTKVETAVAKLDGVVKIKADYQKGVATVIYEKDKVDVKKIVETINTETSFKAKTSEKTS